MITLNKYIDSDLKDVVLLVDRNIEEKYTPSIYNELSAPWPEGFVLCKEDRDLKGLIFALLTTDGYARIIIFCVDDGFRNRGLGGGLLSQLEDNARARGLSVLKLEVGLENYNAIEFYKKRGFTISETFSEFYNDGGDAYNMVKFI